MHNDYLEKKTKVKKAPVYHFTKNSSNDNERDEAKDEIAELGFYDNDDTYDMREIEKQSYFPKLLDMKKAKSFLIPNHRK